MDVLIVGAGAVGQSYGLILSRGGALVSYYVRPRRREEALRGYAVHELSRGGRFETSELKPLHVVTSADEARTLSWDQVWITVPADVLDEPWLRELIEASGDATVVMLQPGLKNQELLASMCGEERLVVGIITFIAWHSPLPGEALPPGVALYVPPLAPVPFSGARAQPVVDAFASGGARARRIDDAAKQAASGSALLQTLIVALEHAGWSFAALLSKEHAGRAVAAAKEAVAVASAVVGGRAPRGLFAMQPTTLRIGAAIARRVVPFDLEIYTREHFTKVGTQTAAAVRELLEQARAHDVAVPHLEELAASFFEMRAARARTPPPERAHPPS